MAQLLLGARWALALTLVAAGCAKLLTQSDSERRQAILNYGVVPEALVRALARSVPIVEIVLGSLFALGIAIGATGVFVALVLTAFAAIIGWHVRKGHVFACGCGAGGGGDISWSIVARNIVLAALALVTSVGPSGYLAIWPETFGGGRYTLGIDELLPIPLVVVTCAVAVRLLSGRTYLPTLGQISIYLRRVSGMMHRVPKIGDGAQ